jgi:hypothetical protein
VAGTVRLLYGICGSGLIAFGCGRSDLLGGSVDGSGLEQGGAQGEGGTSPRGGGQPSNGASHTDAGRGDVGGAGVAGSLVVGVSGSGSGGGGVDSCGSRCAPGEDCNAGECVCRTGFELVNVFPGNAALDVARSSPAIASFSCTPTYTGELGQEMHLYSDRVGLLDATFPAPTDPFRVVLQPERSLPRNAAFFPGERLTGWLGRQLAGPHLWQFWASVRRKSDARFENSGQALDSAREVDLGDLDKDGDLDAVTWNGSTFEILANDGHGTFATALAPNEQTTRPTLGDFDGDGDLDIAGSALWMNQGGLSFTKAAQSFESPQAVADFDGDGDLDVFAMADITVPGQTAKWGWFLFVNAGDGSFGRTTVPGEGWLYSAQTGDVDADGDLDLVMLPTSVLRVPASRASLLLNDGTGTFHEIESPFEVDATREVALGDLDGDGDLDVFAASWGAAGARNPDDRVWLNDGHAGFLSGSAPSRGSNHVVLGDLDGDGDLDAVVGQHDPYSVTPGQPSQVLLNDGTGTFVLAGELGGPNFQEVCLGDLDGDGDLDAVSAEWDWFGDRPAQVFLQTN